MSIQTTNLIVVITVVCDLSNYTDMFIRHTDTRLKLAYVVCCLPYLIYRSLTEACRFFDEF